jgi:hypothetical protein
MGLAALAARRVASKNRRITVLEFNNLLGEISGLIDATDVDRSEVERTLTDGYAHALELETEQSRLQKRLHEMLQGLGRDATGEKARELSAVARRLDGNAMALSKLRSLLAELRRCT